MLVLNDSKISRYLFINLSFLVANYSINTNIRMSVCLSVRFRRKRVTNASLSCLIHFTKRPLNYNVCRPLDRTRLTISDQQASISMCQTILDTCRALCWNKSVPVYIYQQGCNQRTELLQQGQSLYRASLVGARTMTISLQLVYVQSGDVDIEALREREGQFLRDRLKPKLPS